MDKSGWMWSTYKSRAYPEWTITGRFANACESEADLIEYHEPDIRTIWVNVYESHTEPFQTRNVAELNAASSCISIAQPVTFEVKRS